MNLKCTINGKEYDIVEGLTYSMEYNETLDSATLILDQVDKIDDLKPYDDVFIYEGTFNGYCLKDKEIIAFKTVNDFNSKFIYIDGDIINYVPNHPDTSYDWSVQNIVLKSAVTSDIISVTKCTIEKVNDEYRLYNRGASSDAGKYNVLTQVVIEDKVYYRLQYGRNLPSEAFKFDVAYFSYCEITIPKTPVIPTGFYQHLLVDQYAEERLTATNETIGIKYKYKIELFSETKKLETIQLPNISITQPLNIEYKRTVFDYIKQYVDLYGTKIKRSKGNDLWYYDDKYMLDTDLETIFGNVYCPDFSLNNPSLRDVLNQLMLVKDRIAVVIDDVITSMDITKRGNPFNTNGVTRITTSMSSDNYATNLKRTYNNALSGYSSARRVEKLGFRNSDNALMTIGNMRLETKFPIYKINKVLMCYYKKALIEAPSHEDGEQKFSFSVESGTQQKIKFTINYFIDSGTLSASVDNPDVTATPVYVLDPFTQTSIISVTLTTQADVSFGELTVTYKYSGINRNIAFLCKQDITPLVKLEQEKQTLSKDWEEFGDVTPNTVDIMAQYKLCTVSYAIGSNVIDGWGTKYEYVQNQYWSKDATYIENIFKLMDVNKPYGIVDYGFITRTLKEGETLNVASASGSLDVIVSPFTGSTRLKAFFFEIDYEAFYNGTVVHSKDVNFDDISINDNSSSSLTLLEKDGLFQKEKLNRFGNKATVIEAIYDTPSQVQELGSVYGDDEIIYHVEIQLWGNFIKATYYATKDYVLKNYFTSVYAKHRPFSLIDYGQSIIRAENRKVFIELSKDRLYYEKHTDIQPINDNQIGFYKFGGNSFIDELLSFTQETLAPTSIDKFEYPQKINYGIAYLNEIYYDETAEEYKTRKSNFSGDINVFNSGYSLCFNMQMVDNISMGQYIKTANPEFQSLSGSVEDDYTGSVTDFYMTVDNVETGFLKDISFYFVHIDKTTFSEDIINYPSNDDDKEALYAPLLSLPEIQPQNNEMNIIGNDFSICKDNKEVIDMTYQIEPFTTDNDIMFIEWLMKLSELNGVYNKFHKNFRVYDSGTYIGVFNGIMATRREYETIGGERITFRALMVLQIPNIQLSSIGENSNIDMTYIWNESKYWDSPNPISMIVDELVGYQVNFLRVVDKTETTITINCDVFKTIRYGVFDFTPETKRENVNLVFTKTTQVLNVDFSEDIVNTYWYCYGSYGYYKREDVNTVDASTNAFTEENCDIVQVKYSSANGENYKDYYKNLFVATSTSNLNKNLVYNEYPINDNPLTITGLNPSYVFQTLEKEGVATTSIQQPTYIKVDLSEISNNVKSVQLWYNDNGTLKFVFGVNVTDKDLTTGYVKIYASLIAKKDKRVYNSNNLVIGEVKNYSDDEDNYGTNQEYVVKSN